MIIFKLLIESLKFALNALSTNLLRTTLSLLGVTIGIFAIITVFTLVDSLERNITSSFSFLNSKNMDIRRFPYEFDPNMPWWEYFNRPYTNYKEYEFLTENVKNAEALTLFAVRPRVSVSYKNNTITDQNVMGVAYTHKDVYDIPLESGRYFTYEETNAGRDVCILGYKSRDELFFGGQNPLGKRVKIKGRPYTVIGTMKEEGESILGNSGNDENVVIPYFSLQKIFYTGRNRGVETLISVKGLDSDIGLVELEAELTGLLRRVRGLRPKDKNDFSVNRQEAILGLLGGVFDVLGIAGWIIGGFSILVGGFGIANIMFVSVRERTNIIGIQKSLGAKNYFILFQFLFESIFLSIIGGGIGILLVWGLSFFNLGSLDLILSFSNVVLGLGVSATIGTISGIVPAALAARMDPVIAIRTQ
ncbi:MAG: ABC transporter permease [Cyclobacteriaceae bacterium]